MADKKTLMVFKRFLIKNHAFRAYCSNLDNYKSKKFLSGTEALAHTGCFKLISGILLWSETKEGFDYWNILSQKWCDFLSSKTPSTEDIL